MKPHIEWESKTGSTAGDKNGLVARRVWLSVPAVAATVALRYQIDTEGRAMACRDQCSHRQVCFDAVVLSSRCFRLTPPWRRGPATHIESNAEKARQRHDRKSDTGRCLSIYTDGSGIDGETGAAAVCPLTQQTRAAHMQSSRAPKPPRDARRGFSAVRKLPFCG